MGTTQEITKAAKTLASAEKRLAKLKNNEEAAVAKATAKAQAKYSDKILAAQKEVSEEKTALQSIVATA